MILNKKCKMKKFKELFTLTKNRIMLLKQWQITISRKAFIVKMGSGSFKLSQLFKESILVNSILAIQGRQTTH